MRVIIYQSNFGTGARYAGLLAEKTGLPCASLDEATFPADSEVVFIGSVMADELQGLARVRGRYAHLLAVGAVGLFVVTLPVDEAKEKLKVTEPLVLLPGAFDPHKVKGMFRVMLGMVKHALKSKSTGSEAEQKALDFFDRGADLFDETALDVLVELLNGAPAADPAEGTERGANG